MMRLFVTEVDRALSRRLLRVLALVGLCGLLVLGVVSFVTAEDRDPAEQARAALLRSCDFQFEDRTSCVESVPSADALRVEDPEFVLLNDSRPHLTELWPDDDARAAGVEEGIYLAVAIIFLMVAVVLGASLVGADYASRTIETLLTWEPRRIRVVMAKLAAVGVVLFAMYIAFLIAVTLVLLPSLLTHGTTEGADSAWLSHLLAMVGQTGALVAGFAIAGGAVALLARNTGGAIGVFFAYLVGVELVVRGLKPEWSDWYVLSNVAALLDPTELIEEFTRTTLGAAVTLLLYLAMAVAVSAATFRTRDLG